MSQDTDEMLALKFPHLAPIARDLDAVLGVVKTQNSGHARISFDVQGIDVQGNLIVKSFEAILKVIRGRGKRQQRNNKK